MSKNQMYYNNRNKDKSNFFSNSIRRSKVDIKSDKEVIALTKHLKSNKANQFKSNNPIQEVNNSFFSKLILLLKNQFNNAFSNTDEYDYFNTSLSDKNTPLKQPYDKYELTIPCLNCNEFISQHLIGKS